MIARRDFLLGTVASALFATGARADFVSDDAIRTILRDRIDQTRQSVGMVACQFDSASQKIATYGRSDAANGRALDGDTVFEIGSITKVFTALLLTEMVTRGEVALDDPASKYLPAQVKMPERNGRKITLLDLATYTSGLPRIPTAYPIPATIPMPPIPSSSSTNFSPAIPCVSIRASVTSMPIWASGCWATCSR